jgi:hypothetical protein
MGRPHIEFIQTADVPTEDVTEGPFAGTKRQLLSEDDETGAFSALITFPPGWRYAGGARERSAEIFGLRGKARLAGQPFGPGVYAYLPSGAEDATFEIEEETLAFLMVEEEDAQPQPGSVEVIDTHERRLEEHGVEGVPPGLVIKLLRVDEEKGDWTWIAAGPPGWQENRAEIHPTVEEALLLRGDVLLGTRGDMTAGCYFWRPPNVEHGPMFSRNGNLIFFRTKGGGMAVTWVDVPGWEQLVEEYKAREPFYAAPR